MRPLATLILALLALIALPLAGIGPSLMLAAPAEAAVMVPAMADGAMADCPHAVHAVTSQGAKHHDMAAATAGHAAGKPLALMACCVVLSGIAALAPQLPHRFAVESRLSPERQRVPADAARDPVKPPPRA